MAAPRPPRTMANAKMRVLYHHRTQGEEPESVHILGIVSALRQLGCDVDIVGPSPVRRTTTGPSRLGRIKNKMPRMGVELAQLLYNLKSIWDLARAAKAARYDFIYERHALFNFAGSIVSRLYGLPLVLEVNTPYAQAWAKYYGLVLRRLATALENTVMRRADHVFTVTDAQRVILEQLGVQAARISVTHNAINPEEFDPRTHSPDALRRELGLHGIVAGFVGTMNRWQGIQGYLDVVRRVVRANENVSFLFVGTGEGRTQLVASLEAEGLADKVAFAGRQPHATIPRFLAAMDIGLLLDSNVYGSPMKIFEYWAMGKAVIAPQVPPVLEIMRDGQTGLLIAPGDSAAMADHILRLAADSELRERLSDAGRRRVLAEHTWERNASRIVDAAMALCNAAPLRRKSL